MMTEMACAILLIVCGALFVWALTVTNDYREAARRLERYQFINKYAHLLGRTVEARIYEASDWEPVLVVAVSWHGAVCVRPLRCLDHPGRWIHKGKVPTRVRMQTL